MIDKKTYKAVSNLVCKYVENPDVISTITTYVAGHIGVSFNVWSGEGLSRKYVGTVNKHIYNFEDYLKLKDSIVDEVEHLLKSRKWQ